MNKIARMSLLSAAAFANPAAAPVATPAAATKKAGAPKAEDRIAPEFTQVRTDIPLPTNSRATKSDYAKLLEPLAVNGSIGVKNKTKKQISSQISKVNNAKDNLAQKTDAAGIVITKNGDPIKDAAGNVIGYQQVPEMVQIKEFKAFDIEDPKKDPDGASVRIFRIR